MEAKNRVKNFWLITKFAFSSKCQFLKNYNMSKTPISEMSLSKLRPDSCFSAKITPIYGALIKKPERARLCEFETHVRLGNTFYWYNVLTNQGFCFNNPKQFSNRIILFVS